MLNALNEQNGLNALNEQNGLTEGIDWSEAAGRANASKPLLESVREESEAEADEDKPSAEGSETATETVTETVAETPAGVKAPEKPKAASMLELPTASPLEEPTTTLRTPNQSVSGGLVEPSTPKGPTLPPLPQLGTLPPVSTPVREYHAVISHMRATSGLSGHRSRGSGTLSPSVTMQQVQSPGRAGAHAFSGEELETPSAAGEGFVPSEGGSCHSVAVTSDGAMTPCAEKREWGQEKLDIVFDGDEKAGEHVVEPVTVTSACET